MVKRKKYSAGMVKLSFWFLEFKKMISLINSGLSFAEIKELNQKENIFGASTETRQAQIFNTTSTRLKALDPIFYELFEESDIHNQKLIALLAVMESDSLFQDFMDEVFREKMILGVDMLNDSDFNVFFKNKQMQDERVAKWTDHTLKTLGTSYRTVLMESGVLERATGIRKIIQPLLDPRLEQTLQTAGLEISYRILTGVS